MADGGAPDVAAAAAGGGVDHGNNNGGVDDDRMGGVQKIKLLQRLQNDVLREMVEGHKFIMQRAEEEAVAVPGGTSLGTNIAQTRADADLPVVIFGAGLTLDMQTFLSHSAERQRHGAITVFFDEPNSARKFIGREQQWIKEKKFHCLLYTPLVVSEFIHPIDCVRIVRPWRRSLSAPGRDRAGWSACLRRCAIAIVRSCSALHFAGMHSCMVWRLVLWLLCTCFIALTLLCLVVRMRTHVW